MGVVILTIGSRHGELLLVAHPRRA